ncbi:MAG: TRAP transporter small permease [Deltaproteobacteria bacterium]|nr:TRAP transporter small permease [Deltaproteobacteria bacterium]
MLEQAGNIVNSSSSGLNKIAGVALIVMMALVFINVLLRMFWQPILGVYEFTGFLASLTISFALAHCAVQKGHVSITLLIDSLPDRARAVCDAIIGAIGTALFITLGWQGVRYAINIYRIGEVAATTEIPFYPFIFGMAFGMFMLAIVSLIDFFNALKGIITK